MAWSEEDRKWIEKMDEQFTNLFGPDYCEYEYTDMTKHCVVVPGQFPLIDYDHEEWERNLNKVAANQPQNDTTKAAALLEWHQHQRQPHHNRITAAQPDTCQKKQQG